MINISIENISARVKKIPLHFWIFGAILVVGIFLRTYEFRDWMEFNPDQARDALLVQDMLGGQEWPLMGPQAGNKIFKIGPIFYYLEFVAAWLFGPSAEKMAYADLFFSITAIVLAYFFFRKFFQRSIALTITFLFSISFFVVTYSRFAFNPNSIPFFTLLFLFALLGILDNAPKEKLRFAALLGIAMGIGFQLHTILFISMPLLALLVLGYLFAKKQFVWKSVLVTLAFFFLCNAGQLMYEWQNNGANMRAFFTDAKSSTDSTGRNYWNDLSNDTLCHIQGSTYIIASLGSGDKCDLTKLVRRIEKRGIAFNMEQIVLATAGSVFVIGGIALFFFYAKKEKDQRRKRAFVLAAAYCVIIFFILLPVSSTVSMRYYIVIEFVPFLLAGLWIRFCLDTIPRKLALLCTGAFVTALTAFNMLTIRNAVIAWSNGIASTDNVAYFGEVEAISRFMLDRSRGSEIIYLTGKKAYVSRYGKPLEYFAKQKGVILSKAYSKDKIMVGDPFFYVTKRASERSRSSEVIKGFITEEQATFGNITIVKLVRKP
ncbi:MAG: glycosyltransferase family 39 protein [Candidatus Moraniibacteriota bacterium]